MKIEYSTCTEKVILLFIVLVNNADKRSSWENHLVSHLPDGSNLSQVDRVIWLQS